MAGVSAVEASDQTSVQVCQCPRWAQKTLRYTSQLAQVMQEVEGP